MSAAGGHLCDTQTISAALSPLGNPEHLRSLIASFFFSWQTKDFGPTDTNYYQKQGLQRQEIKKKVKREIKLHQIKK